MEISQARPQLHKSYYMVGAIVLLLLCLVAFCVRSFWHDRCGISRLISINVALERYRYSIGNMPPQTEGSKSWRLLLDEWAREVPDAGLHPDTDAAANDKYNPFRCGGATDSKGSVESHFLGVFAANGTWACQSPALRGSAYANIVVVEIPGLCADWKSAGDLIVSADGNIMFFDGTKELPVEIAGCRFVNSAGMIERFRE